MNEREKKSPRWAFVIATLFGIGYFPVAAGTAGTVGAVPLYLLLARLPIYGYVLVGAALLAVGCLAAQLVQKARGEPDPGIVVIDEAVGFFAAMFMLPCDWRYIVAAFFLFRFLDIVKPFPAGWFDKRVKNGFGIMMDDVVAGIYANLIIRAAVLAWG